jgi:hypothetical protein
VTSWGEREGWGHWGSEEDSRSLAKKSSSHISS